MSDVLPNGSVFLHIPKTGGNWVRSVIRQSGVKQIKTNKISKHATYDLLAGLHQSKLIKKHKACKYFCVVRHPLLWYQSWFKYQHDKNWRQWGSKSNTLHWHCLSGISMQKCNDFNRYMTHINTHSPGFLTYLYHSYVLSSDARYLKNENLRDELLSLNSEWSLGLDESIIRDSKKVNVSSRSEIVWNEKVLEETLENEMPLLRKYGYDTNVSSIVNIESNL